MKKNVLALGIATMIGGLGFVGAASAAMTVSESGVGRVLLVPYYTVQDSNTTVLHLVNTDTKNGKAMKVRFRGASNSDDVLDFQVFLSPGDVWTAAVTKDEATGLAKLVTGDNTCTVPTIPAGGQTFITDRLTMASWTAADKAAQTREGYIEILNMSDIDPTKVYGTTGVKGVAAGAWVGGTSNSALYTAIKHVGGVAPCTPAALGALDSISPAASQGANIAANAAENFGLLPPTGGVTGSWYIINVPNSTTYSGAATVIDTTAFFANAQLYSPQLNGPAELGTADPLMAGGLIAAQHYDVPDLSTSLEADPLTATNAAAQAVNLTAAISRTVVANQFVTDPTISGQTDWLISMPTRRYMVAANYDAPISNLYATAVTAGGGLTAATTAPAVGADAANFATNTNDPTKAYRVFNAGVQGAAGDFLFTANPSLSTVNAAGQICVSTSTNTQFDRSETSVKDGAVFSPGKVVQFPVCGEVSMLAFGSSSVLGASLTAGSVAPKYQDGWAHMSFSNGVPVLGYAFQKGVNPQAGTDMIGNYGVLWPHFYSVVK